MEFDFTSFDQVGTLASFKVNVSHNEIPKLWINATTFTPATSSEFFIRISSKMIYCLFTGKLQKKKNKFNVSVGGNLQSNIKVLDMSYNNITDIMKYYFRPVEYSLTHLYLAHNDLGNVTQGVFGNMPHLQWLDLRHNDLVEVDFDCFRNTKNIQVLLLSHNDIMDVPAEALRPLKKLRILDLSHNRLRTLPDNVFTDAAIEHLDLSHNQFMRLPIKSMSNAAAGSLSVLDMSWNSLSGVHSTDAISKLHVGIFFLFFNRVAEIFLYCSVKHFRVSTGWIYHTIVSLDWTTPYFRNSLN